MEKTATQILDYTLLCKKDSTSAKKIKRKMRKTKLLYKSFNLCIDTFNDTDEDLAEKLIKLCNRLKSQKNSNLVGVIFGTNVIVHDVTLIPPTPDTYDILCLECDIEQYAKSDESNIYWTPVEVRSSGNFVINGTSASKIISLLSSFLMQLRNENNVTKSLWKFLQGTLRIFSITQYQLSESAGNYVHNPNTKMQIRDITFKDLDSEIYRRWREKGVALQKMQSIGCEVLPKISLLTTFTNRNLFTHMIYTFLKLNYPRHLLELIIVDDSGSENLMNLPDDKRIKLINLSSDEKVALGYKLNLGIKYATGSVIMHFFDFSVHNPMKIKELIHHLMSSDRDCIMSSNTAVYENGRSVEYAFPDLGNCVYTKEFWCKNSFEERDNLTYLNVIFNFIKYRTSTVSFLPFPFMSFMKKEPKICIPKLDLPFSLECLVDDSVRESFALSNL